MFKKIIIGNSRFWYQGRPGGDKSDLAQQALELVEFAARRIREGTPVNAAIIERQEIKSVEASDFSETLERTTKKWGSVGDIVACEAWESAAYRFQLLTMMADADLRITRSAEEALDPIISIPVEVDFDQTGEMVEAEVSGEKRTMSRGRLRRIQ